MHATSRDRVLENRAYTVPKLAEFIKTHAENLKSGHSSDTGILSRIVVSHSTSFGGRMDFATRTASGFSGDRFRPESPRQVSFLARAPFRQPVPSCLLAAPAASVRFHEVLSGE